MSPSPFQIFAVALMAMVQAASPAASAAPIEGPVEARLVEITDGDSFKALATVWPGMEIAVTIRLRGVDAPEMRGRCERENDLARSARHALAQLLSPGRLRLVNVSGGKYYGRVLADVLLSDGTQLSDAMLASGLVRPYRGGKRRQWCD